MVLQYQPDCVQNTDENGSKSEDCTNRNIWNLLYTDYGRRRLVSIYSGISVQVMVLILTSFNYRIFVDCMCIQIKNNKHGIDLDLDFFFFSIFDNEHRWIDQKRSL